MYTHVLTTFPQAGSRIVTVAAYLELAEVIPNALAYGNGQSAVPTW